MALIAYVLSHFLNMYVQLLRRVTGPIIGLHLHHHPYLVYAISKGSDETTQVRCLVRALAACRFVKYQNYHLMFWISLFNT